MERGGTPVYVLRESVKELLARGKTGDAVDALIAAGHGSHVSIGALTTPIVGGGNGTTISIDQPEGLIGLSGNKAMIPVRIKVECEVGLMAADNEVDEILIGVDTENAPDGVNETTVTNEDIYNMRTDLGNAKLGDISAWSAVTTALTMAPRKSAWSLTGRRTSAISRVPRRLRSGRNSVFCTSRCTRPSSRPRLRGYR